MRSPPQLQLNLWLLWYRLSRWSLQIELKMGQYWFLCLPANL